MIIVLPKIRNKKAPGFAGADEDNGCLIF